MSAGVPQGSLLGPFLFFHCRWYLFAIVYSFGNVENNTILAAMSLTANLDKLINSLYIAIQKLKHVTCKQF